MSRWLACGLVAAGAAAWPPAVPAQEAASPTVTLSLEAVPVAYAAAQVAAQAHVPVLVAEHVTGTVSLRLEQADVEGAVRQVAEAVEGSWLRAYEVRPEGTDLPDYNAADLLGRLQEAWRDWLLRRSDDELAAWREGAGDGGAPPGAAAAGGQTDAGTLRVDMVAALRGPFQAELASLELHDAPVPEALDAFTLATGCMVLTEGDLDGTVDLTLTDQPPDAALDALCRPLRAQWTRLYVIGQPQELTPDEVEQRFAQMLERGAARFWQMPPEERQALIQRVVARLDNLPADVRARISGSPWAPRLMQHVMRYVAQLNLDQRREVAPLLQAFGRLVGQ